MTETAVVENVVANLHDDLAKIFASDLKTKEKLQQAEDRVLSDTNLVGWGMGTGSVHRGRNYNTILRSRLFLKEITPYGFELVAITYKERATVNTVPEEVIDRVYQLVYDLRKRVHIIVKNGKPLAFSEANMVNMFASHKSIDIVRKLDEACAENGYDFITEARFGDKRGMYENMYEQYGCIGREQCNQVSRFLERFMILSRAELVYKSELPQEFKSAFLYDLRHELTDGVSRMDLRTYNGNGTKLHQVLGVPKNIIKLATKRILRYEDVCKLSRQIAIEREYKVASIRSVDLSDPDTAKAIRKQQRQNETRIAQVCGTLFGVYEYCLELDEQYGLSKARQILIREMEEVFRVARNPKQYRYHGTNRLEDNECAYIAEYISVPLRRVIEYAYYQLDVEQGFAIDNWGLSSTYKDYINMSRQLHATKDNFPKHLKTQHDVFVRNLKIMGDEVLADKFKEHSSRWEEWTDVTIRGAKFTMVAPESMEAIAIEGSRMHHCVASYAQAVAEGTTNILFLRDKDNIEDSLVTVEVKPLRSKDIRDIHLEDEVIETRYGIVQARQSYNHKLTKDQADYLNKWAKKLDIEVPAYLAS